MSKFAEINLFMECVSDEPRIALFTKSLNNQSIDIVEFIKINKRISESLYESIYLLLKRHSLKISQVHSIYSIVGPGSYTSMRFTFNFLNIIEKFYESDLYTAYFFNLIDECAFVSNAHKGEFMISLNQEKWRVSLDKLKSTVKEFNDQSLDIITLDASLSQMLGLSSFYETFDLKTILDSTCDRFTKGILPPYYYRDLSEEFIVK